MTNPNTWDPTTDGFKPLLRMNQTDRLKALECVGHAWDPLQDELTHPALTTHDNTSPSTV